MTIEELKSNLDGIVTKVTNLEGAAVKAADIEALKSQIAGIKTGMTATVTGSLGFKYVDGDSTEVPQDAAYFINAGDLATAGRLRANTGKLVTLPKAARLILTTGGAANAKASDIKVIVSGELTGPR